MENPGMPSIATGIMIRLSTKSKDVSADAATATAGKSATIANAAARIWATRLTGDIEGAILHSHPADELFAPVFGGGLSARCSSPPGVVDSAASIRVPYRQVGAWRAFACDLRNP